MFLEKARAKEKPLLLSKTLINAKKNINPRNVKEKFGGKIAFKGKMKEIWNMATEP